jgi:hypothetical protein
MSVTFPSKDKSHQLLFPFLESLAVSALLTVRNRPSVLSLHKVPLHMRFLHSSRSLHHAVFPH